MMPKDFNFIIHDTGKQLQVDYSNEINKIQRLFERNTLIPKSVRQTRLIPQRLISISCFIISLRGMSESGSRYLITI